MSNSKVKVIFICGSSRSGSTLLDRILGQAEGVFSLGEMHHIWKRGFIENQLCGCGEPFRSCRFWQKVVHETSKLMDSFDPSAALELQGSVSRFRHLPQLLFPYLRSRRFDQELARYVSILEALYKSIYRVSGCNFLVDSSKLAPHGLILNRIPGIELYAVHIVRDSRAVAFSFGRKKHRPEISSEKKLMPRKGPIWASILWDFSNLVTCLAGLRIRRYKVVNYESFVQDPKGTIQGLVNWIGSEMALPRFCGASSVYLGVDHTVSGNPMRFFHDKPITIRNDMEWRHKMPLLSRSMAVLLTAPMKAYLSRIERRAHGLND